MASPENSVNVLSYLRPDTHIVRRAAKQLFDTLLAGLAWIVADQLWFASEFSLRRTLIWMLIASMVDSLWQLTSPLYRLTAIRDITRLGFAILTLLGITSAVLLLQVPLDITPLVPKVAMAAALLTGMFWSAVRLGRRMSFDRNNSLIFWGERRQRPTHPTLLVGAGRAGSLVAQELLEHPELGYHIIGFLDDSPEKKSALISGIRVLGNTSQLHDVTAKFGITHAVLAIPTASGQFVRNMVQEFQQLNVKVKTVPGIFNLLGERTWKPDIQEISIEDVLRRDPVLLDHSAMAQVTDGKTVLITGAGGSIGSELTRQLAALHPKAMVLLGRGENSLWTIQREMASNFPDQDITLALMDIRNREGLREIFQRFRPDIVLHAAAHKHVPFLEMHPHEAVDNNIFGTLNVMEAALDFGASKVVNISTDKAVNPTNVLGASKRIAECVVLDVAERAGRQGQFVSVRFGNVLGSRGSVVPIFKEQIEKGGPITVTHPDMMRFFMTIPEASQLVLQAALFGDTKKVYVLNMGEPVKILDLAMDMARLSGLIPGRDIRIDFTGLRPGEKVVEELFLDDERSWTPVHPKLMEAKPRPIPHDLLFAKLAAFQEALHLPYEMRQPVIVDLLKQLVPTYIPSLLGVGKFGGHVADRRKSSITIPINIDRRHNR